MAEAASAGSDSRRGGKWRWCKGWECRLSCRVGVCPRSAGHECFCRSLSRWLGRPFARSADDRLTSFEWSRMPCCLRQAPPTNYAGLLQLFEFEARRVAPLCRTLSLSISCSKGRMTRTWCTHTHIHCHTTTKLTRRRNIEKFHVHKQNGSIEEECRECNQWIPIDSLPLGFWWRKSIFWRCVVGHTVATNICGGSAQPLCVSV